jgi:hypothetical protein
MERHALHPNRTQVAAGLYACWGSRRPPKKTHWLPTVELSFRVMAHVSLIIRRHVQSSGSLMQMAIVLLPRLTLALASDGRRLPIMAAATNLLGPKHVVLIGHALQPVEALQRLLTCTS